MDPISLILSALVAGLAQATGDVAAKGLQGVTKVASEEIQDAYNHLKKLIKDKFAGEPKAEMVLEEYEIDPETYEAPLKKKLASHGVDKDSEIIKAAQDLLDKTKEQPSGQEIINQTQSNTISNIGSIGGNFEFKPTQIGGSGNK